MGMENNSIKKRISASFLLVSIINGNSIIDITFVVKEQTITNDMVANRNVQKLVTSPGISRSKPPLSLQLCSIIAKDKNAMLFLNFVVSSVIGSHYNVLTSAPICALSDVTKKRGATCSHIFFWGPENHLADRYDDSSPRYTWKVSCYLNLL